jgi:hypothetical protein
MLEIHPVKLGEAGLKTAPYADNTSDNPMPDNAAGGNYDAFCSPFSVFSI